LIIFTLNHFLIDTEKVICYDTQYKEKEHTINFAKENKMNHKSQKERTKYKIWRNKVTKTVKEKNFFHSAQEMASPTEWKLLYEKGHSPEHAVNQIFKT